MASQHWLFLAAFVALAEAGWSQPASGWRVYRISDGLPETACASVTIGLNGKVLATHPNADWISELDGYIIRTFPRPGPGHDRICESPSGQLWAATPEGFKEWKDNAWVLHPVAEIAAEVRQAGPHAVPFLPVQQGRVLFLLPDRLMEFNIEELNRPRTIVLRSASQTQLGRFNGITLARDGGLWIAGARGLAKAPGPIRNLKPGDEWREHLPPAPLGIRNLRELREDGEDGVTMIAESGDGQSTGAHFDGHDWMALPFGAAKIRQVWRGPGRVIRAASLDSTFQWHDGRFVETEEISVRQYFDVAIEHGGAFWLATQDGLFRYAPPIWRIPPALSALNAHVRCLARDTSGRLWFASNSKLHSLHNDEYHEFPLPESTRNSPVTSLWPLPNGALLLACGENLLRFQSTNGQFNSAPGTDDGHRRKVLGAFKDGNLCFETFAGGKARLEKYDGLRLQPFPTPDLPMDQEFSVLFEAQNGDLWLGGARVVAECHDGKWRTFASTDRSTPEGAECFTERADGKIWGGAPDKLWEFDGRNWSLVRSGFDRLNTLLRARDGSIWAASNNGLDRFWEDTWIELGIDEGLPSLSIHEIQEDTQGHLWAATARGLSRYYPEADPDPPRTGIQKLSDENEKLIEGGTLNLLFNSRDRWKFTPRDRLLYSYQLGQRAWSAFQDLNAVSFPELPAGKHSVQVRAMDRNGNVETPAQLEFAVALPWYRETRLLWISFAGLALALFFAALSFNRHRKLLRSYAEVGRQVAARTRELEVANRELLHSQKMNALGTLAAGIAHDFNNILSIVKGSAQIIEENPGNPEKIRTRVDRIKTVVEQGSGIVKAMLGFSRDSEGELSSCDPNVVVEDTLRLLGDRFLREVEVKFEPAPGLPEVPASKDFVQQILLNFIFNAAESMSGRKQIVLTTQRLARLPAGLALAPEPAGDYLTISVRDSGCGIPPENMPRIFEPFFTTKSMSARRGTGLGLSMVYELAKKMGAGLAVESVVDAGSVFTLVLPVREGAA